MPIRRSRYVHLTPLGDGRVLAVHAMRQLRLTLDETVAAMLAWFAAPRDMPADLDALPGRDAFDADTLARALAALMEQGLLTDLDPDAEEAALVAEMGAASGEDAGQALDALRRRHKRGADAYWSEPQTIGAAELGAEARHTLRVLMFGDCDLQMEAESLRREAAARGIALELATAFPDDLRLAAERPHDALLVGALRSRRVLAQVEVPADEAIALCLAEARAIVDGLRRVSDAPILLDALPEPTVQPLGLAEPGADGHRNRFRRLNLALEVLAAETAGVRMVDVAAALNAEGSARLLDDGLVGFHHFGSPGWMLRRPARELAAVHGLAPDPAPLIATVGPDPYARERVVARAHVDALVTLFAIDRKKCVILDLDGTLWPGVLAETGAPFAWTPEVSGPYSHVGLWFGLHEALKALKARGVLLACVSKNDEAVVRALWRYPDHYPHERLLTPDDFVAWRVNWADKPSNIVALAQELGFARSAFLFIDDHPVERARVREALPEVEVWGEDPWSLRRRLLTDPRLQTAERTAEAAARTALVKAQLGRSRARADGDGDFLARLQVEVEAGPAGPDAPFARIAELFDRTTQFNATGRRFGLAELERRAADGQLFVASARDRFGDYGLVAAAVTQGCEIVAFVMSCRVIGLGVEAALMGEVLAALRAHTGEAVGRIVETERNGPVRNLFADAGFRFDGEAWRKPLEPIRLAG
jgi:FkbH-like protein